METNVGTKTQQKTKHLLSLQRFSSPHLRFAPHPQLLKDITKTSIMQQHTSWWVLGGADNSANNSIEPKFSGGAGAADALLTARGGALMESNGGSSGGGSLGGGTMRLEKLTRNLGNSDEKVSAY